MRRTLAVVVALLALSLAGCNSTDHGSGMDGMDRMQHGSEAGESRPVSPGAREIPVIANRLRFTPETMQLRAGIPVAIVLTSKDIEHDFYVQRVGHIVHASANATSTGGLTIETPGTYRFWCTVDGHKQAGMVGTITVNA